MNRPKQPKPGPRIRACNACQSASTEAHCKAPKHCAWVTCTECGRVSDNFHHHIEKRPIA
jgi:hypothetical protein